ncbi:hypothetical protein VNO80_10120 [Phaseolus coccineus]|uniref:Uncharacterized protein n=1 Tax=Phaseolus coccineus TaxID=3886 RepID=A0AAN9NCU2_PHACN
MRSSCAEDRGRWIGDKRHWGSSSWGTDMCWNHSFLPLPRANPILPSRCHALPPPNIPPPPQSLVCRWPGHPPLPRLHRLHPPLRQPPGRPNIAARRAVGDNLKPCEID